MNYSFLQTIISATSGHNAKAPIALTILLPRLGQCDQKGSKMLWAQLLAYVTGTVDQELLTERVSGGGEPHPESPDQGSAVTLSRRKSHLGGDRSPAASKITALALGSVEDLVVRSDSRGFGVGESFSRCAFALIAW